MDTWQKDYEYRTSEGEYSSTLYDNWAIPFIIKLQSELLLKCVTTALKQGKKVLFYQPPNQDITKVGGEIAFFHYLLLSNQAHSQDEIASIYGELIGQNYPPSALNTERSRNGKLESFCPRSKAYLLPEGEYQE